MNEHSEKIQQHVGNVIASNNDHTEVIAKLLTLMDKNESHLAVLSFKFDNPNLPKNKAIMVDQVLAGLHRLIDTMPNDPHTIK